MAGKGLYRVGHGLEFISIQEAIDALINDQGQESFTSEQRIVVNDDNVYDKIVIPSDSLKPTSLNKLYIEGKKGLLPVIDGSISSTADYGVYIGKNVPFVTIRRFQIQNFYIGLLADISSNYCEAVSLFIKNNLNVGIFANLTDNFSVFNSLIMGGDYNIAAHYSKNIAIVHNTLFNDGSVRSQVSTDFVGTIYLRLARDFGSGVTDTGTAWIRNNIVANLNSDGIILFEDDLVRSSIYSDYNNIYTPNSYSYLVLKEGTRTENRVFDDLESIRNTFNTESNSITADPLFLKPIVNHGIIDGYKIDLSVLVNSPVVRRGESYNPSSPSSMPSWINSTYLLVDFEDSDRPSDKLPTLGAIEADSDYNLLTNADSIPNFAKCNVNPLGDIVDRLRSDLWYPRVKSGTFFVQEKEYYLYANKHSYKLSDCAITLFNLTRQVAPDKDVTILLNGESVPRSNWDIVGSRLSLKHHRLNIDDLNKQVEVKANYQMWLGSAFAYRQYTQRFRLNEGKTLFLLLDDYVLDGSPVVITDDMNSLHDNESVVHKEFSVVWNEEFRKPEIVFAQNTNIVTNPQFDYSQSGVAANWIVEGTAYTTGNYGNIYPYAGDNLCVVTGAASAISSISQIINISPYSGQRDTYYFSWFGLSPNNNDILASVDQITYDGSVLSSSTGTFNGTDTWKRYLYRFGTQPEEFSGVFGTVSDIYQYIYNDQLNPNTNQLKISISAKQQTAALIDAVQFEHTDYLSQYHRLSRFDDITVEHESSKSGFYTVKDLTLTPSRNTNHNGFLTIPNIPATQFDASAPVDATTLSEYRWQYGRLNILPWSRLTGRDKLTYMPVPDISGGKGRVLKDPYISIPKVNDIRISPSFVQALQGSNGEQFAVETFDQYNNPYAFSEVTVQIYDFAGEYPGILRLNKFSIPVARDVYLTTETDSAGRVSVIWEPPSESDVVYSGPAPTGLASDLSFVSEDKYLDVKYKVSPINYGNITIRDYTGGYYVLEESIYTTGSFPARHAKGYSYVNLPFYPVFDSVSVRYLNEEWLETKDYLPDSKQFQVIYPQKTIRVNGNVDSIDITYRKAKAWITPDWGRRIFLSKDLVSNITGNIIIGYDAELIARVSGGDNLVHEFSMIAQNPHGN